MEEVRVLLYNLHYRKSNLTRAWGAATEQPRAAVRDVCRFSNGDRVVAEIFHGHGPIRGLDSCNGSFGNGPLVEHIRASVRNALQRGSIPLARDRLAHAQECPVRSKVDGPVRIVYQEIGHQ